MTKRAASGTSAAVGGLWDHDVPSDETLVRWQALVDGQMGEVRDEFLGRRACESTYRECQARVDYLYGVGIFRVDWYGGTALDILLIDRDRLLKRLCEIERSRYK